MSNEQRTNHGSAGDVRAHERGQYATPPYLPSLPTQPEEQNRWSSNARTNGSADTREKPIAASTPAEIDPEDDRWLAGYRRDRIAGTVMILGFKPPVTELLRRKRWAVLVAGEGWTFPARYLEHVEKLLLGADVDLFDIEGAPTPAQRDRDRLADREQTSRDLAEIRAAREQFDPAISHAAYLEARAALDAALEAKKAAHEEVTS